MSRSSTRPWILLNPGPVNVTERVRQALLGPDICHREEEFSELLHQVRAKILKIFGISQTHTVAVFTGSGTTALEAMLSSFAEKNRKTLVLSNGVYGERIKYILEVHDCPVTVLSSGIGGFPSIEMIESILKNDSSIHAIALVHHETSTGMLNPLSTVGALAKKYKKTFFVDAISSLGAEPIHFKNDSIDFCAGTSGKCLHGFPGVSFVILSNEAAVRLKTKKPTSLTLDLSSSLKHAAKNETAFTPAVQLFYAFNEALNELIDEGLQNRIQRYRERNAVFEKGFIKLGVEFLIEKAHRSHVLTALWMPTHLSYKTLHDKLKAKGFVIYAGQSSLQNKIFRVSNLGNLSNKDLEHFFDHFQKILPQKS